MRSRLYLYRFGIGGILLKISTLVKLTITVLICLSGLILSSIFFLNDAIEKNDNAVKRQLEYAQLANQLMAASDYLTNEVRAYVQFGDQVHYDNYWREVNETKTRDNVVK